MVSKQTAKSGTIQNIKLPYPTEGVIRSAQLSDNVAPENSCQIAVNMNFDSIGTIQTRPGITNYANKIGGYILALGTLGIQSTSVYKLFCQAGQNIYGLTGITWTFLRVLTVTNKARFSQFL